MAFKILVKMTFLTFDLGLRSKAISPNESPYMNFYMSTIKMEPPSLTIFEIFDKNVHLTFGLGSMSNVMEPNEAHM